MTTPPLPPIQEASTTVTSQKPYTWARFAAGGYECSTAGDRRFSALVATLADGRTIEQAYQLDVKGYRAQGSDWRLGKGRPPLTKVDLWPAYLDLWRQWAEENPALMHELAKHRLLTDKFAISTVSQARALAELLNERENRHADI